MLHEQVGLEPGTTTGLRKITKSAEDIRREMGLGGSEDDSTTEPGDSSEDGKEDGGDSSSSTSSSGTPTSKSASPSTSVKPGEPGNYNTGDGNSDNGNTGGDEQDSTEPVEPPAEHESSPDEEAQTWWKGNQPHIVRSGHMDLALFDRDGYRKTALFDDENPENRVERASGTFAFALTDEHTRTKAPEKWCQ